MTSVTSFHPGSISDFRQKGKDSPPRGVFARDTLISMPPSSDVGFVPYSPPERGIQYQGYAFALKRKRIPIRKPLIFISQFFSLADLLFKASFFYASRLNPPAASEFSNRDGLALILSLSPARWRLCFSFIFLI